MKRLFILCLFILLGSVVLVAAIEYDPGYMLLSYGLYTVETSIWIGVAAFILLFIVVQGVYSLLRTLITRSNALHRWFTSHGYKQSQRQTTNGLIAFIEGNWERSRRTLSRAAQKSDMPLLNYLIAARASHELGDNKQIVEFLQKAQDSTDGAQIAVELTQAELQYKSGQFEQALATLTRLRHDVKKYPHVLHLLKLVYIGLNDWKAILNLLPDLRKYKVASVESLNELELTASKARLEEVSKIQNNTLKELKDIWSKFPKSMQHNTELVTCFVEYVIQAGGEVWSEKLIRDQLKREWNKDLVSLYGKIHGDDINKQLLLAEKWLLEHNDDSVLLLALGRLSLRNTLWGKAREYFEKSLKMELNSEVCAELGRLLAHLNEFEKSNEYFHKGLLLNANSLPELPMPEKQIS